MTQCLETTDLQGRVRAEALRQRAVCYRDIGRLDRAADDEQAAYALFVGARLMVQYAVQTVAKARLRLGSATTGPTLEAAREVFAELRDDFGHAWSCGPWARRPGCAATWTPPSTGSAGHSRCGPRCGCPGGRRGRCATQSRCLTAAGQHVDAGLMRVAALSRFDDLGLRESAELRAEAGDP